jgi:RNA polymerase sigma-70 factor (ECF subfamily)
MYSNVEAIMRSQVDGGKAGRSQPTPSSGQAAAATQWRQDLLALAPAMRAFAWSISHDATEADDLVQETLLKAWRGRDRFQQGTNLRAWLFTILRNTYYTGLARRRREVADVDGQWAAGLVSPANQDWTVSIEELRQALLRLPATYREALILVGGAGMTYEEAAEICNCAVGTIKSRVNRARERLLWLMDGEPRHGK